MKKLFLLLLLVIISAGLNTEAYQINYNSAGGVTSTMYTPPYGGQPYINNYPTSTMSGFGSNALFSPNTVQQTAERRRQIKNEETYLKNTKNINVNINHTGINPYYNNNGYYNNYNNYNYYNPTRYYNNGIRYYNNFNNGLNNIRGLTFY